MLLENVYYINIDNAINITVYKKFDLILTIHINLPYCDLKFTPLDSTDITDYQQSITHFIYQKLPNADFTAGLINFIIVFIILFISN